MIEDILRKRRAETEQAVCRSLQYAYKTAELAVYTVLCCEMDGLKLQRSKRSITVTCWTG